ncbi:DUF2478 domain-containing protein [Chenggangzhangella methanolivorans]|uniref:DUF2478 domain-containing protein n=1 Tax=Chenggangzhangella methanolivorans TaxID=1437009 RepID=A0A9E6R823_9HYPH|nr:DUF2478 domain-containing protein [Chenggangzhangella methanolivorans]QZN99009.1 DUF2478 domain-containing protein [Chenggangzhangella methanolivorans]
MAVRIVALQGAAGFVVQVRLAEFARARAVEGIRVAGCVEEFSGAPGQGCSGRALRDLTSGRRRIIGQDLGSGSLACQLDAVGVSDSCQDALDAIERGCDVAVLAKFGKLESERGGLVDAFAAAAARDVPIVTAVAPQFAEAWARYSGGLAAYVDPSREALETWWLTVCAPPARAAAV